MKARCNNPKEPGYPRYGGRGIRVCLRWLLSFENFYTDMGPKPGPEYSLDRRDVNGDYDKFNCRWATAEVQANNRRVNVYYGFNGQRMTAPQIAREVGMNKHTLKDRLDSGLPVTEAISKQLKETPRLVTHNGKTQSILAWSTETGLPYGTLKRRFSEYGMSPEEALSLPVNSPERIFYTHNGLSRSVADWSRQSGVPFSVLNQRLKTHNWPIDRALETPVAPRTKREPIVYDFPDADEEAVSFDLI